MRNIRRKAIGTGTVNALTGRGNSITAAWTQDMQQLSENASAVDNFVTGKWPALLRTFSNRISQRIGAASSAQIMRILSETDPPRVGYR